MRKFTVYHARRQIFSFSGEHLAFNGKNFEEVATVECKDLEHVFQVTNHNDHDWTTNKEVLSCNATVRSTSVGDIVVDSDGKKWIVMGCGWKEI